MKPINYEQLWKEEEKKIDEEFDYGFTRPDKKTFNYFYDRLNKDGFDKASYHYIWMVNMVEDNYRKMTQKGLVTYISSMEGPDYIGIENETHILEFLRLFKKASKSTKKTVYRHTPTYKRLPKYTLATKYLSGKKKGKTHDVTRQIYKEEVRKIVYKTSFSDKDKLYFNGQIRATDEEALIANGSHIDKASGYNYKNIDQSVQRDGNKNINSGDYGYNEYTEY